MTTTSVRVALPQLFLWREPGRIQEYPEAAASAVAGRVYQRLELERDVFDIAPTMQFKGGAPRGKGTHGVINACGLERSGDRYRINGINLFEHVTKGVVATRDCLELGRLYRHAEDPQLWPRRLALQLLMREPRTRLIVGLGLQGWSVDVDASSGIPRGTLSLASPNGDKFEVTRRDCAAFNLLLAEHAELALGPAWRADLTALGEKGPISWEGVQGSSPSTNDLPTALKKALVVFFHIGAFDGGPASWELDGAGLAEALGIDDLAPLGFEDGPSPATLTDDEAFTRAVRDCAGADGFVIVSQLADRFGELLHVPAQDREAVLDSFARTAMYHDHLQVLDRHPGQPRMGRGLFGEPGSRSIRIDFTPLAAVNQQPRSAARTSGAVSSNEKQEEER